MFLNSWAGHSSVFVNHSKQNTHTCFVRSNLQYFILYPETEFVKPTQVLGAEVERPSQALTEAERMIISSLQPY